MAQGSIKKHIAKDGTVSYRARVDGGIDPVTGKRRQVMKTFHTKAEAQTWVRDQQHRADRGEWIDARKTTLGEWIAEWLAGAGARGRRESTQITYSFLLNVRVVPALGHTALAKLTPTALERFFHQQEQGSKPGTMTTLYAVVRVCLADAERLGLIAVSPMRKVRAPSATAPERQSWTPEQARHFREQVEAGEDYALWLLLLTCALRVGEVLALTWSDCDFSRELLYVRRTLTKTHTGLAIGDTTKSGKSRTLPMAAPVVAALREQRARSLALRLAHADVWEDQDLVFPNATGGTRLPNTVRKRLKALCAKAELPALTPHGLRHTAASLLSEHAPIAVAREVLGHSSLAITNTYIHATDAAKRAGADALARLLTDEEASV